MTPRRVIVWSTGRTGSIGLRAIASRDDLDLIGLWVHSPDKVGRDAGELCGIEPLGVEATNDVDELLALGADCVFHAAGEMRREEEFIATLEQILRSGANVVNVTHPPLVFPHAANPVWDKRLQAACEEGGTSFYTSGIDPGFVGTMTLAALGACSAVRSVRMLEIINYADWDSPWNLKIMGFGKADVDTVPLLQKGALAAMWGPAVELVAGGLGLQVDDMTEHVEVERADVGFDIAAGHIAAGTIAALRFEIRGMVDGEARVVAEHVTRLRESDGASWQRGDGYRILVEGEPNLKIDIGLSSDHGDTIHAAYVATAMPVVNAIGPVCDAPSGVLTDLDLPPRPSRAVLPPRARWAEVSS